MRRNRTDPEHAIRFARKWFLAWNSHDLERILDHYDDSVEFTSPYVERIPNDPEEIILGKALLRDSFSQGLAHYSAVRFKPLHTLAGMDWVTLVYRSIKGMIAAETMAFRPEGSVTHVTVAYSLMQ